MSDHSACSNCGACCASFRVSFYWSEACQAMGGSVPEALTEKLNNNRIAMKGTNQCNPRCVVLQGDIGQSVSCSIYPQRASVCREFDILLSDGSINEACNRARARWGLPPITDQNSYPPGDIAASYQQQADQPIELDKAGNDEQPQDETG